MRGKLSLNLNELRVDTFDTTVARKGKGMVFGEQCTCWTNCGQNTCPGCPTCDASCNGTCYVSCNGTCNTCPTGTISCYETDCGCDPRTYCYETACGNQVCCA